MKAHRNLNYSQENLLMGKRNQRKLFIDMADYIDVLDLLFVLGKIVLEEENGIIKHA